jgi:hypothetical protein
MTVADEFYAFRNQYNIGADLISSIGTRYRRITTRLNKDFWNTDSDTAHSLYVGSYGRDTAAKGVSDIDVAFRLPAQIYHQYNAYQTNGQSAVLQAVKNSLLVTFRSSSLGGDGQVVVLTFDDGVRFEILPVFDNNARTWTFPNSNDGGSWKTCDPKAEIAAVSARNTAANGNLKALCRMMRIWRDFNNVQMTGALIDVLACQFIENWDYRDKSYAYHDYMVRDFLSYLYDLDRAKTYWLMPGSNQRVYKTGVFWLKALTDYGTAVAACNMQDDSKASARKAKWRTVFGSAFPI